MSCNQSRSPGYATGDVERDVFRDVRVCTYKRVHYHIVYTFTALHDTTNMTAMTEIRC